MLKKVLQSKITCIKKYLAINKNDKKLEISEVVNSTIYIIIYTSKFDQNYGLMTGLAQNRHLQLDFRCGPLTDGKRLKKKKKQ